MSIHFGWQKILTQYIISQQNRNSYSTVHLHTAKYLVPLDTAFDVEETISTFTSDGVVPIAVAPCWFYSERFEEGFGDSFCRPLP